VSHWAHFTVHRFICVYLCVLVFCVFASLCMCCIIMITVGGVDLNALKPNPSKDLSSFSALTPLVGSFHVPDMTYNVFVGMLKLAQPKPMHSVYNDKNNKTNKTHLHTAQ